MAKNYTLVFMLRNQSSDLAFPVRESEQDRLRSILSTERMHPIDTEFFWFDTIDGRGVAINLADLQAVRYLWDAAVLPPDSTRFDGGVEICLRGRSELLHTCTDDAVSIFDFFTNLQYGPEIVSFPQFNDEDGETMQFNSREIVWAVASKELLDAGCREILDEVK